jgi:hypothetical protein
MAESSRNHARGTRRTGKSNLTERDAGQPGPREALGRFSLSSCGVIPAKAGINPVLREGGGGSALELVGRGGGEFQDQRAPLTGSGRRSEPSGLIHSK